MAGLQMGVGGVDVPQQGARQIPRPNYRYRIIHM